MFTDAESDVLIGKSSDIEMVRRGEDLFVAVGRRIEQHQRVALANLMTVEVGVLCSLARKLNYGRGPAHDFLNRRLHQRGIASEPIPLVGIVDEGVETAGGGVAG